MEQMYFLVIFFVWCLLNHYEVEGRILSMETHLELEKQVKLLKKPAIISIQTTYGDTYDCVDFYQQPAFDHPLLANHTLHSQDYPKGSTVNGSISSSIWLDGKGCPVGTVPIKRFNVDDLLRAKSVHNSTFSPHDEVGYVNAYAVVRTRYDPNKKYYGAGMITSLYTPAVTFDAQYSSSRMKIQNGADSIEVGWTVNPPVYKDRLTRFYIKTNVGQTHCFDALCPGFVVQNPDIPLGGAFTKLSTRIREIFDENFFIYRDPNNGNWVLQFGPEKATIGYWPKNIMAGLTNFATYVDWGGEIGTPGDVSVPEMGNGHRPDEDTFKDAFCRQITVVNENNQPVSADGTEPFNTDDFYYTVIDEGNVGGANQHLVLFGGPTHQEDSQ